METKIEQIIRHTHLTYKYVLLNGLLAKATNADANPLALQAGADLEGAFDARSLCHKVIVPYEKTILEKRLGGSNEPFLNKPARFTHLSMENAVRRGGDRDTLQRLISVFDLTNDGENAEQALIATLVHILSLESRVVRFNEKARGNRLSQRLIANALKAMIAVSCEGETLVLAAALAFEIYAKNQTDALSVQSHPSNQAGASSKEIADVDVWAGNSLRMCAEIKDKTFSKSDIDHAAGKVAESGYTSMLFVPGPNASTDVDLNAISIEYDSKGFDLSFIDIDELINVVVSLGVNLELADFIELTNKHLEMMRAKEQTITHVKGVVSSMITDVAG